SNRLHGQFNEVAIPSRTECSIRPVLMAGFPSGKGATQPLRQAFPSNYLCGADEGGRYLTEHIPASFTQEGKQEPGQTSCQAPHGGCGGDPDRRQQPGCPAQSPMSYTNLE